MRTYPGLRPLLACTFAIVSTLPARSQTPAVPAANAAATASASDELARMYQEDQADRTPKEGQQIDVRLMSEHDEQRRARLMELYRADQLKTGADYFHAAMIMQHGGNTEYYLLANEFSVAALALGYDKARWLVAASHDRLLKSLGHPQRFGTQYGSKFPGGPMQLDETDDGVRDSLRQVLKVPPLAAAKAREATMTARFSTTSTKPTLSLVTFKGPPPPELGIAVLDLKAGDQAPEIVEWTAPVSPLDVAGRELTGYVILSFIVEIDGSASQIHANKSSSKELEEPAIAAISRWKFKAGSKDGQPGRTMVGTSVHFLPKPPDSK